MSMSSTPGCLARVDESLKQRVADYGQPADHSEAWVVRPSLEMFLPITRDETTSVQA
jgi:hypothetical protein